jgi:hypothetical protein
VSSVPPSDAFAFLLGNVAPHVELAVHYLSVPASGRQCIANLNGNVFRAEYDLRLPRPEQ